MPSPKLRLVNPSFDIQRCIVVNPPIAAAVLNAVFKSCKLLESLCLSAIAIRSALSLYLVTVQSFGLLTKVLNKTVKLEGRTSGF